MSDQDISTVSAAIEKEKAKLNEISQELWNNPELNYEEVKAHKLLTDALRKFGFTVQEHYLLDTAFYAEYCSKKKGPTIAVLCEYDALTEIGHACGHNLIAELALATGIGVKAVMEANPDIGGKVIVLGCPAEEGGGGKIRLLEKEAFANIDAAVMLHPTPVNVSLTQNLWNLYGKVAYTGRASHASAFPWEGRNALDAAVSCYQSLAMLRQHIKPLCRIHSIITNGGSATNIVPKESAMAIQIRSSNTDDLADLKKRVSACIESAATCTNCEVQYSFDDANAYANVISNQVLAGLYRKYGEKLGMVFLDDEVDARQMIATAGSTDVGNVSYVVPAIHGFYAVGNGQMNHTEAFTKVAGAPEAQVPTLTAAKALALTVVQILRSKKDFDEMKQDFQNVVIRKEVSEPN